MPLFSITWADTPNVAAREKIRADIRRDMAALTGVGQEFIAVLFKALPGTDAGGSRAFTEVYISEGRPDAFKDSVARLVKNAFCAHTGLEGDEVCVIIHDIWKGSVAAGGRIVNRTGTAAETVIRERSRTMAKEKGETPCR